MSNKEQMLNKQRQPHLHKAGVSTRFFFREGDCDCYTLNAHLQYMVENHIEEMPIWLAKRETGVSHFYCKHFQEIGEITKPEKQGGFFDLPKDTRCKDKSHEPPTHIHIPQGKGYRHVCPSCGKVTNLLPPQISF